MRVIEWLMVVDGERGEITRLIRGGEDAAVVRMQLSLYRCYRGLILNDSISLMV